jgi:hypothetical protein
MDLCVELCQEKKLSAYFSIVGNQLIMEKDVCGIRPQPATIVDNHVWDGGSSI